MSTRLTMRVLATLPSVIEKETVASEVTLNAFSPDVLDSQLRQLLASAATVLSAKGFADPKFYQLELSIQLSSDDVGVRPALHLSRAVIDQLAAASASLDFDPYCDA